jgi:hypothetical protein
MTTRKRPQTESEAEQVIDAPATQDLPLNVDSLAEFMELEEPDRDRLSIALELAKEAATATTGRPIGETACHGIRHGIHMLASQLLLKEATAVPVGLEIPAVVRYLWQTA